MRDKNLERKISFIKDFLREWVGFRDFLKESLADKTISAKEETQFLEIKSRLAQKYQMLVRTLGEDFISDESLMDIVSHAVSLESMSGTSDIQFRKIENDWHLSYIHLNSILGNLESDKENIANINQLSVILNKFFKGATTFLLRFLKFIAVLIPIALLLFVGHYFLNKKEGQSIFEHGKSLMERLSEPTDNVQSSDY